MHLLGKNGTVYLPLRAGQNPGASRIPDTCPFHIFWSDFYHHVEKAEMKDDIIHKWKFIFTCPLTDIKEVIIQFCIHIMINYHELTCCMETM